jgi:hypothetical protein
MAQTKQNKNKKKRENKIMKHYSHFQAKQSRIFYPLPPVNLKYLFHLAEEVS